MSLTDRQLYTIVPARPDNYTLDMKFRVMTRAWLLFSVLSTVVSPVQGVEALVIDDFASGAGLNVQLPAPGYGDNLHQTEVGLTPENVLGGARSIDFRACFGFGGSVGPMPIVHDPEGGTFLAGGTPESLFCEGPAFRYGNVYGDIDGNSLDLDLSGYNAVRVELLEFDPGEPNAWYEPPVRVPEVYVSFVRNTVPSYLPNRYQQQFISLRKTLAIEAGVYSVVLPFSKAQSDRPAPSFDLSSADVDGVSVSFTNIGLGGGIVFESFQFEYLPALDGDYDGNGVIDSADLAVLHTSYGMGSETGLIPGHVADGNADGVIDAADYTVWRDAFASRRSLPAPEPATLWSVLPALVLSIRRGRRKSR